MADDWISVCTTMQTGWNIPNPALTELTALRDTATDALETALTASGSPTAQVAQLIFWNLMNEPVIKIIYITGSPANPANKGCRIWYGVACPRRNIPRKPKPRRTPQILLYDAKKGRDLIRLWGQWKDGLLHRTDRE